MNKSITRLVFSQNVWKEITMPKGYDPSWNSADMWYYATIYAAAEAKGMDANKAEVVAEAAVSKRLYPGLMYEKALEEEIILVSSESIPRE
uniref:Uncharacterized protein n=1 Tax=viral metagenome TaxID=1070528 RepID=A0A6C0KJI9_9ZZZZ